MNTHEYNGYSLKWNEETGIVSIFNNDEFIKKTLHYSEKDDAMAEAKRIVDYLRPH